MSEHFRWLHVLQSRRTRIFRVFSVILSLWAVYYYLTFEWMQANNIFTENVIPRNEEIELESNGELWRKSGNHRTSDIRKNTILTIDDTNVGPIHLEKRNINTSSLMRQYVLPLIAFQSGPNGVYNAFRRAMVFASIYERCLVIPPFHQHKLQDGVKTERSFNETFDTEKIVNIINLCDLDEFKKHCGSNIPLDWIVFPPTKNTPSFSDNYNKEVQKHYKSQILFLSERFVNEFYNITSITLPQPNITLSQTQDIRESLLIESETKRCVVYFPAVKTSIAKRAQKSYVEKHLERAPYIRRMAAKVMTGLLTERYAVLHWRNKTGEKCITATNDSQCSPRSARNLKYLKKNSDTIAESLYAYLNKEGVEYLYVASLPFEQFIVQSLRKLFTYVYTSDDAYYACPKLEPYRGDLYVLSLVEQEIAEHATIFIGTTSSSWSFYVENSRDLEGKKTVYLQKLPGMPNKYKSSQRHII